MGAGLLRRMDGVHMSMKAGATGEVDFSKSFVLAEPPSFYARRNCWYGASFPSPRDVEGRDFVGVDHILWGNDYPHYEGCYPYSRENMRLAFASVDPSARCGRCSARTRRRSTASTSTRCARSRSASGITPGLVATPLDEIPADSTCPTFQMARYERAQAARKATR